MTARLTEMTREASVTPALVDLLVSYAEGEGLDTTRLAAAAGVSATLRHGDTERIPFDAYRRLTAAASRLLDQPDLGLRMGRQSWAGSLGAHGLALATSTSVAEVTRRSIAYSRTAVDGFRNEFRADRSLSVRLWRHNGGVAGHDALQDELNAMIWLTLNRQILGRHHRPPVWMSFRHTPLTDLATYAQAFGCEVQFGAAETAICTPQIDPTIRLAGANASVSASLEALCATELNRLTEESGDWLDVTRAIIDRELSQEPTLTSIAAAMDLTPRQLRHRLAGQDTTFQSLLDEQRRHRAQAMLRQGCPLIEISDALGFSEQSAFQRAFRRWSNSTPGKARNQI